MRRPTILTGLVFLLCALSLRAETPMSITPNSGPTRGNIPVQVKGDFGSWPYGLIFGGVSVQATRLDEHTLIAYTPPHPPGTVDVTIFEYDIGISTELKFTYTQVGTDPFERVLLPIFAPPARGAFGSEFRTELRAWSSAEGFPVAIFGVEAPFTSGDPVVTLPGGGDAKLERSVVNYNGNPGRWLRIHKDEIDLLGMNLRVFDVSRDAKSFGTEIPIVREREFSQYARIAFPAVPVDRRFRTTLRIYSAAATTVRVQVGSEVFDVKLQPGSNEHEPAYAAFTDFPVGGSSVNVSVDPEILSLSPVNFGPAIWAFLTITNNETQQITTMSPQR